VQDPLRRRERFDYTFPVRRPGAQFQPLDERLRWRLTRRQTVANTRRHVKAVGLFLKRRVQLLSTSPFDDGWSRIHESAETGEEICRDRRSMPRLSAFPLLSIGRWPERRPSAHYLSIDRVYWKSQQQAEDFQWRHRSRCDAARLLIVRHWLLLLLLLLLSSSFVYYLTHENLNPYNIYIYIYVYILICARNMIAW